MKKILFGICALALSATAFGAVYDDITGTAGAAKAKVTLPVELKANVVSGSDKLFIEGGSENTYGSTLELNFGDITKGEIGETSGSIRVYRGLGTTGEKTPFGGTLEVAFDGLDVGLDNATSSIKFTNGAVAKVKLVNATPNDQGTVSEKKINVTLEATGIRYDEATLEESTLYEAKIKALTEKIGTTADAHPDGRYTGSCNITATLTGVTLP